MKIYEWVLNSENSLILRILIQTKCHKIHGSVLIADAQEFCKRNFQINNFTIEGKHGEKKIDLLVKT
jgi:hypothetical protein